MAEKYSIPKFFGKKELKMLEMAGKTAVICCSVYTVP